MAIPAIVIQLAIMAATSIASYAMMDKPDDTTAPNQFGRPRVEDGMIIPVVFGPALMKDLCVLGFGDTSTHEIIANGGK